MKKKKIASSETSCQIPREEKWKTPKKTYSTKKKQQNKPILCIIGIPKDQKKAKGLQEK